jgi:hypothetical protein
VSYAHEDDAHCTRLLQELTQLARDNLIAIWTDHKLVAGDVWDKGIREKLEGANLILLLISSSFMASEYIYRVEFTSALERAKLGEAVIVPILVRPCDWEKLSHLQALPSDSKPVTKWVDPDDAWFDVLSGLKATLAKIGGSGPGASAAVAPKPATVKTIPDKIARLCDRTRQEAAFSDFHEEMRVARPGAPQLYCLIEDDLDRPEFLVERLELRVSSLAASSRGDRRGSCLRETGSDDVTYGSFQTLQRSVVGNFYSSFGAPVPQPPLAYPLLADAGLSLYSHIVSDQTLDGEKVHADADKLLDWLIDQFWAGAARGTEWLVFIILRFSSLDARNADLRLRLTRKLRRLFDKEGRRNADAAAKGAPALLLPAPDPLTLVDVADVLKRFPIDSVRERNALAQRIWATISNRGEPRLDDLHLELEQRRRNYLRNGSFD